MSVHIELGEMRTARKQLWDALDKIARGDVTDDTEVGLHEVEEYARRQCDKIGNGESVGMQVAT